ncbi:MAG TPA: carbohydrate binding domain-containing protein [Planctomycetota bacterium]|nr:carbohydrate binding domain-containing protein [Planctomycetota bacterium]
MDRRVALAFLGLSLLAAAGVADEVDALVAQLKPPTRFADHKPAWSVKKAQATFEGMGGPETMPFWFVMDGDRHVAIIPTVGFHSGTIYVQDFRPGQAPKELKLPTERWHIDTSIGSELRTNNFIPEALGDDDATWDWKGTGDTLTCVRRFKGNAKFNRWAHRTKSEVAVDATNTIVFRVDPRLGYVVEATYDIWTDPPPKTYEYSSAATSGRYLLWPGQATCFRHAITPVGSNGTIGYACNHAASKKHPNATCRDGGFVAFLNDETGWSPTLTLTRGGDAKLVICGAHTDLDFVLTWPEKPETRPDGLKRNGLVKHRLLALPPELTKHVWDTMEFLHAGEHKLMIRFGVLEDFEDQPLELTTRQRGMPWSAEVTDKFARSGKKSITFTGTSGHGDPQIALKPSTRYKVEAWVKVVELPAEQRKGPGEAAAYLTGWTYQWSPHADKPVESFKSNIARPGGEWQKIAFEFTAPKWAPFIQLAFHADNCTVCLDDFQFVENQP